MKKHSLGAAACLAFGVAGCGNEADEPPQPKSAAAVLDESGAALEPPDGRGQ